ncbi:SusC/RagA family TonB-linked outer membrane protein [uncultured Sunxiuqinia sp.]|uniref:SusC/RagA family TonB-linked outer membrane protein n=1 Tax=uncultured Sunxiuqinia sp. TaxID=1573825 RepID=UPI0030D96320
MKKKALWNIGRHSCALSRLIRIMKLTTFLLLITFMGVQATVYSQTTELNLKAQNSTVKEILRQIEDQSEFFFMYNDRKVDVNRKVSIDLEKKSIDEVLQSLFDGTNTSFLIKDRQIVLYLNNDNEFLNHGSSRFMQKIPSVSGKVTDETGEGLPGVTILVKGTTTGTITDLDGNFQLDNLPEDAVLVFSFVGMQSQEIPVTRSTVDVILSASTIGLEEVVAIGYGTIKAGDVTSSVASVKPENFNKGAVKDLGQLVAGKVAGLIITNPSGDPTSTTQIKLRGTNTFGGANTNPLILIDGIPGNLTTVPPEDVESVEVLKDGSAAAIYGTRGTNGVILITTKQFKKTGGNVNKVEYSGYVSTATIARRPEMLSADEFRAMYPNESDNGANTDWLDEITRTPLSHVHNVTFQGGTSSTNYIANANYNSSEGIMLKSANETFKGRFQVNHNMLNDKLKFKMGIIGMVNEHPSTTSNGTFNGYTYRMAVSRKPTDPVQNEDGTWHENFSKFEYENPVARLKESDGSVKNSEIRYNTNIIFNPISDLTINAVLSYLRYNRTYGYSETLNHVSTLRDGLNGWSSVGSNTSMEKLAEITALYEKEIKSHRFSVLGGYSYNETDYESMGFSNYGFQDDYFGGWHNIGIGSALKEGKAGAGSEKRTTNLIGFFGRGTYGFNDKYLFMGSLRYEGASQLWGTDNEWGLFPSISLGWRITEESFMQNQQIFDNLKLRAGYGVTGSQPNQAFLGVGMLTYGKYAYVDGEWLQTIVPASNTNPDLKWEEKKETNIGLDFTSLNGRLSGTIDVYNRKVDGLLYDFTVSVPPYDYGTIKANGGVMENKGLEIMLSGIPVQTNDFEWNTSVTYSTNNNKLKSINGRVFKTDYDYFYTGWIQEPIKTQSHRVQVGERIGNFWGFKVVDIDEEGKWIYEDRNGDLVSADDFTDAPEDKKVIGNGVPAMYASWNNNLRYKNFDLSVSMRGAFDYQIINEARMYYENPKNSRNENRLTSVNDLIFGKATLNKEIDPNFNSYYVEDGDYWKIDNVTLGYSIKRVGRYFESIRLYGSVINALTISGYKGVDPEVNTSGLAPGYDNRNQYPSVRTYTFGVNVKF